MENHRSILEEQQFMQTLTSLALKDRSANYPEIWNNKVPLKVKMLDTVKPDIPILFGHSENEALKGMYYCVWVNTHGAVSAILPNLSQLGLKPHEFEVIEWHS